MSRRRKSRLPRCEVCGKRAFASREDAAAAALHRSRWAGPLRIYEAHGSWHMTSRVR